MSEYSVATTNRFALSVSDDEDLYELLEKQQEEKKRKEEQAAEAAKAAKVAPAKGKVDKRSSAKTSKRVVNKQSDEKPSQPSHNNRPFSRNEGTCEHAFMCLPVIMVDVQLSSTTHMHCILQKIDLPGLPGKLEKLARMLISKNPLNLKGKSIIAQIVCSMVNHRSDCSYPKSVYSRFGGRGRRGGFNRGGRGGSRGGFGGRPAKREFERHSGSDKTGVKAVEKREGSGPHNWGDEIEAQLEQPQTEPTVDQENTEDTENTENQYVQSYMITVFLLEDQGDNQLCLLCLVKVIRFARLMPICIALIAPEQQAYQG